MKIRENGHQWNDKGKKGTPKQNKRVREQDCMECMGTSMLQLASALAMEATASSTSVASSSTRSAPLSCGIPNAVYGGVDDEEDEDGDEEEGGDEDDEMLGWVLRWTQ